MTTTLDQLIAILAKDYKLEAGSIGMDTPLESLGIDSLGVADMLFNVEDEFKISLPPEPADLVTVGDVARYIDGLIASQAGSRSSGSMASSSSSSSSSSLPGAAASGPA